jgi:hypothetical protein
VTDYPYEIHVTVRSPDITEFRRYCGAHGIKPIVLDLQDREGTTVITDVMTSSKATGGCLTAWVEKQAIAVRLIEAGFNVVRIKVETVPWNPVPGKYFEAHVAVRVRDDQIEDLRESAHFAKFHMSQNVFKRDGSGTSVYLLTRREYGTHHQQFENEIDASVAFLRLDGFDVLKIEKELCVYDSNTDHDTAWIGVGA